MSNQLPLYLPIPSYDEDYERYKKWKEEQEAAPSGSVIVIDLTGDDDGINKLYGTSTKKN
tara:strand:- start:3392 stop:3571 length:180 start_codon:yes stop_codon:yes gene_type:complete